MTIRSLIPVISLILLLNDLRAADQPLPIPQSRLRGFYAKQARQHLGSGKPTPKTFPAFPGHRILARGILEIYA